MARFTFTTLNGPRTVRAADEATARAQLEAQLYHPDPDGAGDWPYTPAERDQIARDRATRANALCRQEL
ncbi:hypothetical protein ACSDR0_11560 [Streptosporangium sp. G11]|uniref:hypothetical protein n=1 Tax=Streptosporangium sp. G11 TaxID=3436926 RepID=UPI003EB8C113